MKTIKIYTILLCLIFLSCKNMTTLYFVNPQPRGGKEVKNTHEEFLKFFSGSIDPKIQKMFSKEADPNFSIDMRAETDSVAIILNFKNRTSLTESFSFEELTINIVEEFGNIVLKKGNIYCFNKLSDKGYYTVPLVLENDRSHNRLKVLYAPFEVEKENWEDFEKVLYKEKQIMNMKRVDFNDSTYTYALDPTYLGLRWLMKKTDRGDYSWESDYIYQLWEVDYFDDLIFVVAWFLFNERIETDSLRYKAIFDSLGVDSKNIF